MKTRTRARVAAFAAGAAASLVCTLQPAYAHSPIGGIQVSRVDRLAEESNLVFIGDVVGVKYRQARLEGIEGTLPVTEVTYTVGEVLRGDSPGQTFTMRFPGGSDGRGGFVEVSGVPLFQPGEKDVLFVRGNGEQGCPLVNCEYGRFRVLGNAVYNTHGSPVRAIGKQDAIARGLPPTQFRTFRYPAPDFDALLANPEAAAALKAQGLSPEQAKARYQSEAPKEIVLQTVFPVASAGDTLVSVESSEVATRGTVAQPIAVNLSTPLKTTIRAQIATELPATIAATRLQEKAVGLDLFRAQARDVSLKAVRKPVRLQSVATTGALVIRSQGVKQPLAAPAPQAIAEDDEIRALKAQDFDPVLKKR
jgi:hypothetical protein